jgi:hypothetical protein
MEVIMNQAINHIKISPTIKVQPITIVDTLKQEEPIKNKSFISKIFDAFFKPSDLSLQEWQRIEAKPRRISAEYSKYTLGGRF